MKLTLFRIIPLLLVLIILYGCASSRYNSQYSSSSYTQEEQITAISIAVLGSIVLWAILDAEQKRTQAEQAKLKSQIIVFMNSQIGVHISQQILRMGPPNSITTDGLDGKIYIWQTSQTKLTSLGTTETIIEKDILGIKSRTTHDPARYKTYKSVIMFYVDSTGHIYHWRADPSVR